MRWNKGKVDLAQIPISWLKGVARLFEFGELKYTRGNWRTPCLTVLEVIEKVENPLLRHLTEVQDRLELLQAGKITAEEFKQQISDPDSGIPYTNHVIWNAIMLNYQLVQLGILEEDPGQCWLKVPGIDVKIEEWARLKEEHLSKKEKQG